jgi:hypothetical protein
LCDVDEILERAVHRRLEEEVVDVGGGGMH